MFKRNFKQSGFGITEAVALSARALRDYAEENHDFGYELAMRVARVMLQRLH